MGYSLGLSILCIMVTTFFVLVTPSSLIGTYATIQKELIFDDFNGISNWNTSMAINGSRWCMLDREDLDREEEGTWLDVSKHQCGGSSQPSPYGTIALEEGEVYFNSNESRVFPLIWSYPLTEVPLPFPFTWSREMYLSANQSGNFALEVGMKYVSIGDSGSGIIVKNWTSPIPEGDNSPRQKDQNIFVVWADTGNNSLKTSLNNKTIKIDNPLAYHIYRLEYEDGWYSLYVNNTLSIGPLKSDLRPNIILIGNPGFTHNSIGDWSDFKIDYLRLFRESD